MPSRNQHLGLTCLSAGGIALIVTGLFAVLISIAFASFLSSEENRIIIVSVVAHFMLFATGVLTVLVSERPGWFWIRLVIAACVLTLFALVDSLVVMILSYEYKNLMSYSVPVFVICIVGTFFLAAVIYASVKRCQQLARRAREQQAEAPSERV